MSLIWNSALFRDTPLDKQWPACCNSGCQIWLPGCSASGLGAGAQWKRGAGGYAKLKGPARRPVGHHAIANTTNERVRRWRPGAERPLGRLWAELEPSQLAVGGEPARRRLGRQSPPPLPPGPKPAVGRSFGTGGGSRGQPSPAGSANTRGSRLCRSASQAVAADFDGRSRYRPIKPAAIGSRRLVGHGTPLQLPPKPQHQQTAVSAAPLPPPPPAKQATNVRSAEAAATPATAVSAAAAAATATPRSRQQTCRSRRSRNQPMPSSTQPPTLPHEAPVLNRIRTKDRRAATTAAAAAAADISEAASAAPITKQ
uniref:Uncharacterized protein n=1 Tax=Macrostomum lignano TaxID=282301 RepID=A0A1I8FEV9_9PLAT